MERAAHGSWWQLMLLPLVYPMLFKYRNRAVREVLDEIIDSNELKLNLIANSGYFHTILDTLSVLNHAYAQSYYYRGGGWYIKKIPADDLLNAEYILVMRDGKETVVMQIAAKLNLLLAMAGWAKPATSTTEGKEILKVAIGAVYTCETLFKITTLKVLPDNMRNYRAEEAIFTREEIVVTILEFIKVVIK